MIDRHHLLECILWPNGDGTFRKIVNRAKRLRKLGIYGDYKLTIQIEHNAHSTMHRQFEKGTEYGRSGENNPMFGTTGNKSPRWKGDMSGPAGMYKRALKLYKSGQISEEEFRPFREAFRAKYLRPRKC